MLRYLTESVRNVNLHIFNAPARPLSRVIGGAEAGVLLSIIIMMIFMLNIGKARQLLNQLEVT